MDDKEITADVRTRLITSGLSELEEHGLCDFSLRRVAQAAQVSCAAPYRHFRDKDELILAIIAHVREGWTLLAEEISSAYRDPRQRVIRLSLNAVRFWVANGSLRSVLTVCAEADDAKRREMSLFDAPINEAVRELPIGRGEDASALALSVLALIYGSVTLILCGADSESTASALIIALDNLLAASGVKEQNRRLSLY